MRSLVRSLIVVVALAASGGACGGDEGEPVGATGDGTSIAGDYVATEVIEAGEPKQLVGDAQIWLRLHDGQLSATAGCNTIGGEYTVEDGTLHVGALATTDMGCDPPRHEQDEWLASFLSAGPRLQPGDGGFVLRTDAIAITFVDESVVEPNRDLVGTTWMVDGFVHGPGPDGAVSSAPDDAGQLVFDPNGFVTGDDGCNGFGYGGEQGSAPTDGLRYEVEGGQITFTGSAVSTLRGCDDVDTDPYWSVLAGTVTWEIDGNRLLLLRDSGDGVMYQTRDER